MNKNYSLTQLIAIYTTYKDLDRAHIVYCCTCGTPLHIETFEDCYAIFGHYLSRSTHPKLKYHPNNIHCQCPKCNMQSSSFIDSAYKEYMHYRYGDAIDSILFEDEKQDKYTENSKELEDFYIQNIISLSQKFPELQELILDTNTGEVVYPEVKISETEIEKQWNTYSTIYRQDLDTLVKALKTEPIEYERL